VLFSVIFAWLLLGQLPGALQLLGGLLLLGGVIVVRAGEPERGPSDPTEPERGSSDPAEPERTAVADGVARWRASRRHIR
jgi:hypothetical protein